MPVHLSLQKAVSCNAVLCHVIKYKRSRSADTPCMQSAVLHDHGASMTPLQIAEQARIIVAQEQKYSKDITAMNAQLMHYSAMVGIQSFSPSDLADEVDDDDDANDNRAASEG